MDDYEDFDDKQNTYPSEKSLVKLHKQVTSTRISPNDLYSFGLTVFIILESMSMDKVLCL